MNLTSTSFQLLTIAVAVVATAALVLLWNRVPGKPVVRFGQRLLLLVLGNGLTAVAVLVSINIAYGGLVVSFSDLFADTSGGPAPTSTTHRNDSGGIAGRLKGSGGPGQTPSAEPQRSPR